MITVATKQKRYGVIQESGFSNLAPSMMELFSKERGIYIITDETVMGLYGEAVFNVLSHHYKRVFTIVLQSGEINKNLDSVNLVYKFLLEYNADRDSVLLALGGGIIGDITGFAAATYMRGTSFVQVPTTLLAQVDSSVGGKTGVDYLGYKNIIGAFYQPDLVYINLDTIATLPPRQFSAGMAEVIKYGFIMDKHFFKYITDNSDKLTEGDVLSTVITKSIINKADVVEKDESDRNIREILNFGHTFGHGIEALSGFNLLHGECVALGMIAALKISEKRHGFCQSGVFFEFLDKLGLPKTITGLSSEGIYKAMLVDKKSKSGIISFVLLKEVGSAYTAKDVTKDEIEYGLKYIMESSK